MGLFNTEKQAEYRSRLDVIRSPESNHMSRTRTRVDRFINKNKASNMTAGGKNKKKGFAGAYVADPRRQEASGFKVAGILMQHLHAFVIDMDLTSLYPSMMILMNMSPKTFVAKFILDQKVDIPMYSYIHFIDKEDKSDYKMNPSDFFMECYTGHHFWALMEIFLHLKSSNDILNYVDDHIGDFQ